MKIPERLAAAEATVPCPPPGMTSGAGALGTADAGDLGGRGGSGGGGGGVTGGGE